MITRVVTYQKRFHLVEAVLVSLVMGSILGLFMLWVQTICFNILDYEYVWKKSSILKVCEKFYSKRDLLIHIPCVNRDSETSILRPHSEQAS